MAPRFDPEALTIEVSVADLIDRSQLRSLGFSQRGGYERMWVGQAIHGRYQDQALLDDPTYRREVSLEVVFPHRGWEVTVRGRADGVRRSADGTLVVEEIKSIRRGGQIASVTREVYERQALLYAWMLSKQGEPEVESELVLIEIGTGAVDHQPVEGDLERLEASIKRRLNRLLGEFEKKIAGIADRQEAGRSLEFPHSVARPGQQEIIDSVATALEQEEHLLLEAPTGIGKTVAAIYPALRYALTHDKKVFVLTAKNLQQEMATAVLGMLNTDDRFHSLRLRAKAGMCANQELICHEEFCPYARDYAMKLHSSGIMAQVFDSGGTLLPDAIFELAQKSEVCPFEISLETAANSQVVVGDYNYAFDPYVSLRDFGADEDLSDTILIIDEVHNLVDRGRGYYSPTLSSRDTATAAERLAQGGAPVHRVAAELARTLTALIEREVASSLDDVGPNARATLTALPEDELWALRPEFDSAFIDYLEHQREARSYQEGDVFVELYYRYLRFLDAMALCNDEAFDQCVESRPGDNALRILCKDPSRFIGRTINRSHTTIGLSATLSPSEFYLDLLGFDRRRTVDVTIPSPFPEENRRVVIDPSIATTYRERPRNYARIAERLTSFALAVPGNSMALFPSYKFLADVAERIEIKGRVLLVQKSTDGEKERQAILETLRSPLAGDTLLLAVAGGVFAEGVDYPGDMLSAVAVVGPCLPGLTLEQTRLKDYFQDRFERGFEYSFVVPGMTRVVQAVGRLIRSADDTGVIALLDHRFLDSPYREFLPKDWLPIEGPDGLIGDPAEIAAEFFGN